MNEIGGEYSRSGGWGDSCHGFLFPENSGRPKALEDVKELRRPQVLIRRLIIDTKSLSGRLCSGFCS